MIFTCKGDDLTYTSLFQEFNQLTVVLLITSAIYRTALNVYLYSKISGAFILFGGFVY